VQVEDAVQGWDALQNDSTISAVICELDLCVDNNALLERIRGAQNKSIASLPVLVLVGEKDSEDQRDRAFSVGASDFITMPFSSTELKARIRLHTRLFGLQKRDASLEVPEQATSIDMLNTLMQEQYFETRVEQELSFSVRHKSFISACHVKVDGADEIGEQYGSKVLTGIVRTLARMIEQHIRCEDAFAYLGNASFAILYPVTNGLGAHLATRRLLDKVEKTALKFGGKEIPVTLSAGLFSEMPDEKQSAQDVLEVIRNRLEKAVQKGGNQIVSNKIQQELSSISVEQALKMLSNNETEGLDKQMPQLLDTLYPLLEFARNHTENDLDGVLDSLGLK
jgi:diguanylate cyclase (GGDEF)-like protein